MRDSVTVAHLFLRQVVKVRCLMAQQNFKKMILSKTEIQKRILSGEIEIAPYNEKYLNPNGYDLHLGNKVLIPELGETVWDAKKEVAYAEKTFDESMVFFPGVLYLASTIEYTAAHNTVPVFEGKSSIGRMGVDVHICAGFGDVGFCGHWTLEIRVMYPTRLYAGMPIGQLVWHTLLGETDQNYKSMGSYSGQSGEPNPTKLWKNFDSKILIE